MRFLATNDSADFVSEGYVLTISLDDLLALNEAAKTYVEEHAASELVGIDNLKQMMEEFENAVEF